MIVAPQSGDEMRDAAEDLTEAAKALGIEVQSGVAEMAQRGKAILEVARSALDRAMTEGRRAADEQRESLESQVNS